MAGEGHVANDNDVFVTKTHWPYGKRQEYFTEREFQADRAIVITRNPIDVFVSFFLLQQMGSHSTTCVEKINVHFAPEWDAYIRGIVPVFKAFHAHVLESVAKEIPTYLFRYEDQTTKARETTTEFFKVIMDTQDID